MSRVVRITAVHLALVAMMLRALLPAGWMPSGALAAPLVICTMQGPVQIAGDQTGHKQHNDTHRNEACPFAAAPNLSTPSITAVLALPSLRMAAADEIRTANPITGATHHASQRARAPPHLA